MFGWMSGSVSVSRLEPVHLECAVTRPKTEVTLESGFFESGFSNIYHFVTAPRGGKNRFLVLDHGSDAVNLPGAHVVDGHLAL